MGERTVMSHRAGDKSTQRYHDDNVVDSRPHLPELMGITVPRVTGEDLQAWEPVLHL